MYAIGVPGMTVRNSLFHNCATMDIFFTYGYWWTPLPPAYGNVTLENNDFGHTYKDDGTWHYYSVYVANTANDGGTLAAGWSATTPSRSRPTSSRTARSGSRWVGNLGAWNCVSGRRLQPQRRRQVRRQRQGRGPPATTAAARRSARLDRPAATTSACGPARRRSTPRTRRPSGHRPRWLRAWRPARRRCHEFGAPAQARRERRRRRQPGRQAGKRRLGALPKLRPHLICKHRRRSCARSARLSLSVTARSRLLVRVARLRRGHEPRRVRTLSSVTAPAAVLRIRARGLPRGRYRVLVVATSAARSSCARVHAARPLKSRSNAADPPDRRRSRTASPVRGNCALGPQVLG